MTQELPATYNTTVLKNWAGRWLKLPYQTFALQVCWITMRYYCHGYYCYCCWHCFMIYDYDYDYDCILCDPLQFFFLSHVWAAIPQLIDITLSARYGRYQGWLGTVHFQLPIPGLCIPRDSSKCTDHDGFYCHSRASVDFFNFVRQLFLLFHLFLLSSKDLGPLAQL